MTDFTSLQLKIDDLKAKVAQNSITPTYLGSLLDDFLKQMQAIDMTDMSDDVRTALGKASDALARSISALDAASAASESASLALDSSRGALEQSTEALHGAAVASVAADRALKAAGAASDAAASAGEAVKALADSKGVPSGIAPLGPDGKIPAAFLPLVSGSAGCDCSGVRVLPFDAVVAPGEVYDGSGVAMVDDGVAEQWFTGDFSAYGASEEDYNMRISHAGVSVARVDCLFLRLSDEEGHVLFAKHSYGARLSSIGGMAFESLSAEEPKDIVKATFKGSVAGLPMLSTEEAKEIVTNTFNK